MRRARDPYRRWDACRGNARVRRQERERAIRPHAVASSHPVVSCPVRLTLYPVRTWTALSRQTPRGVPGLGRINGQIVRRRRHHEYVDPVAQEDLIHLELQRSADDHRVPERADVRDMCPAPMARWTLGEQVQCCPRVATPKPTRPPSWERGLPTTPPAGKARPHLHRRVGDFDAARAFARAGIAREPEGLSKPGCHRFLAKLHPWSDGAFAVSWQYGCREGSRI